METGIKHLHSGDVRQFPWLEAMVSALDDRLRLRHGVIEYTNSPECLFRIQLVTSNENYVLSDGTCIRPRDRVANLHVWNEQFPCFVGKGPTLAWACRVNHAFDLSLRELAGFLEARRDLDDVVAICANMSLKPAERSAQLVRFVSRFGFEQIAAASSRSFRQQVHWFGENILISMMVLARNAAALRIDTLRRDRTLVFLSRRELRRRYGFARDEAA
jgi:YkoP-like protein